MVVEILSCLVAPLTEIAKCLFDPLKRQFSYLKNYDENLGTLRDRVPRLVRKRNDIQKSIADAIQRRQEEPLEEVKAWLDEAGKVEPNMIPLEEQVKQSENSRCFKVCPDWSSRRRLSKQAVKMLRNVDQLLLQANENFSAGLTRASDPPSVVPRQTSPCVEGLASRETVMEKVREALRDENTRFIGLHGMGGIGKTTLVNKLNNELQESQLFAKVIFVTVSNSPDLKKIQDRIGSRFGLEFASFSEPAERASRLLERLKREKVLIILDDVWTRFELSSDIGIPSGSDHVGCKVILTTRNREVCRQMGIETVFEVKPLSESESWVLFTKKAGDVATQDRLLPLAQKIAGKCKGSPLAIVVLGSLLKDVREEFEWNNVSRALEYPDPIELKGIIPEVITSLKYSYDHLEGPEIKLCFLFFSMFPEDYNIPLSRMRDYGIGEDFLKLNKSLEDASNKLLHFVRKLKACGLLLDGGRYYDDDGDAEDKYVRMHDVVRDVAIHIASNDDNGFLIKAGQGLSSWPRLDVLDTHKRISFMNNECIELPTPLESPQVRTLLLSQTWKMQINIGENLFENLKALVVLHLSDCLVSVPKSLRHLTNLRTLYLEECDLSTDISTLGELKNLEILRLSKSNIDRLPEAIGNLTNLRCLDLTDVSSLSNIAPNAISRLTKLEELHMLGSFEHWDMNGHASLAEVVSLPNLVSLKIKVRNGICAYQDILACSWKNLKEIVFLLEAENIIGAPYIRLVGSVVHIQGANKISNWVKILCQKASHLILSSCYGFKGLEYLDAVGCFSHLKRLHVQECLDVEYLLRIGEETPQVPFGILEELIIINMYSMKNIFRHPSKNDEGHIMVVQDHPSNSRHRQLSRYHSNYETGAPKTFQNLRYFSIAECKVLKNLFTFRLAQGLQQLQNLSISDCDELKEIIAIEEDEKEEATGHQGLLPSLKNLQLKNLPRLTVICQHSLALGTFQKLEDLDITSCHRLKNLFTFRLAQGLQQLQNLSISECDELKEIITIEEDEKEEVAGHQGLLRSLEYLHLRHLPHLIDICQHSLTLGTFQSLEDFRITGCHGMKILFTFCLAQGLQKLQNLFISDSDELKEIIAIEEDEKEEAAGHQGLLPSLKHLQLRNLPRLMVICQHNVALSTFQSLEDLDIFSCHGLKNLFTFCLAQGLQQLQNLSISKCNELKEIIAIEEDEKEEAAGHQGLLPSLKDLQLVDLPRLMSICQPSLALGTFQSLERLYIDRCHGLKYLFTFRLAQGLQQLQYLYISECDELKEIIAIEEGEKEETAGHQGLLPSLKHLQLKNLPGLMNICQHSLGLGTFQSLKVLGITNCHGLKYLFTFRLAQGLQQLQNLSISKCDELKEIIAIEEDEKEGAAGHPGLLPSLKRLQLEDLPGLMSICQHSLGLGTFQSLEDLKIDSCHRLKNLFTFRLAQGLQKLQNLSISDCDELKEIIAIEEDEKEEATGHQGLQSSLMDVVLENLPCLTGICQGDLLLYCSLKSIAVRTCPNLKRLPLNWSSLVLDHDIIS